MLRLDDALTAGTATAAGDSGGGGGVAGQLNKFVAAGHCTDEHRDSVLRALDDAYATRAAALCESLAQQGKLKVMMRMMPEAEEEATGPVITHKTKNNSFGGYKLDILYLPMCFCSAESPDPNYPAHYSK